VVIPSRDSHVDQGITVNNDFSFELHVNNIVSKAWQRIGTFFHGFLSCNLSTMRLAFITYNRPIFEYDSIIWNPNFIHLTNLIEKAQRNFFQTHPFVIVTTLR
jgi:hypothetical protein